MPVAMEVGGISLMPCQCGGERALTFLVLLLLKVANHLTEQGLILGVQWLRHDGRWLGGK